VKAVGLYLAICLLATVAGTAHAQGVEARLLAVEARLDSLIGALSGAAPASPFSDTLSDSVNLRYGVAGRVGRQLDKRYYFNNYCDDYREPFWVAYRLVRGSVEGDARRVGFREDREVPDEYRSKDADYRHSGWSRGHLAPAETFSRSVEAIASTFLFSNMVPQNQQCNGGVWSRLERGVRNMVHDRGRTWVVTGATFLSETGTPMSPRTWIGMNYTSRVAVPTHLYTALLVESHDGGCDAWAVLIPNAAPPAGASVNDFLVSVDSLEKATGYDFFPLLDDSIEGPIEGRAHDAWPW
jgi:DNA/RNA endonuclease G (NUC1)